MTMSEHDLRDTWRHRSRPAANRTGCLTEDDFARLLSGEATADERTNAARHMAVCATCTDEYALLEPLRDWAADAGRVMGPAIGTAAGTSGGTSTGAAAVGSGSGWQAHAGVLSSGRPGWLLAAACVLIAVLGTTVVLLDMRHRGQVARLEGQLAQEQQAVADTQDAIASLRAQLDAARGQATSSSSASTASSGAPSTPWLGVPIEDLEPVGSGANRGEGRPQVVSRGQAPAAVLILNFPPLAARTTLRIDLVDEQGQTRWSGTIERPRQAANLNLTLPLQAFPAGSYRIRLTRAPNGQEEIAVYRITLR